MGYFRFRKSISILPGVKINLSKTGVSASVGGKGATANIGTQGQKKITFGVPGTGLSYQMPMTSGAIVLIVAALAVVGIAYLIQPELVRQVLHWWQPRWF
jgi:hypothetical protein